MRKLMLLVVVMLLMMGTFAAPAMAQHNEECPGRHSILLLSPLRNFCNDTTFHNERWFSPGTNINITL